MEKLIHLICYWGIILCGVLSLFPFRLTRRWKSWSLYLPEAGIVLFVLYQSPLLAGENIQTDMPVILPMMLFMWINGLMKVGLLRVLVAWAGNNSSQLRALPQRRIQMALSMAILAGGALLI